MTRRMERHARFADPVQLAVLHRQQLDLCAEPFPQDPLTGANRPVLAAARPGVIGMGVGDQCPRHGAPGIDPGPRRRAVEPLGAELQQAAWGEGHRRWGLWSVVSAES